MQAHSARPQDRVYGPLQSPDDGWQVAISISSWCTWGHQGVGVDQRSFCIMLPPANSVAEGLSVRATEELVSLTSKGLLGATRRRPTRHFIAPAATDLAERLSDRFDTTVRVDIGRRKGKVTIEFATVDDLERIVAVMAPELAAVRGAHAAAGDADTEADLD